MSTLTSDHENRVTDYTAVVVEPKAYGICSKDSNSMKSANPHSRFYEADTSRTLDLNCGNPACNQGGIAIVEPVPYTKSNFGSYAEGIGTLKAKGSDAGGGAARH